MLVEEGLDTVGELYEERVSAVGAAGVLDVSLLQQVHCFEVEIHLFQWGELLEALARDGALVGGEDAKEIAADVRRVDGIGVAEGVEVGQGLRLEVWALLWAVRTVADLGVDVVDDFLLAIFGERGPSILNVRTLIAVKFGPEVGGE